MAGQVYQHDLTQTHRLLLIPAPLGNGIKNSKQNIVWWHLWSRFREQNSAQIKEKVIIMILHVVT